MTLSDSPVFSIVVPTRGRPDSLRRLLDSFKVTTTRLETVEIILVIDVDDSKTVEFVYDEFPVKRVVVHPGLTMGALNMAGYEVSSGKYIMLLNDDVIVRTRDWDEKVLAAFKTYADEIVLVHVNDKIFEEKLCTFPFLSRKYCELAGGICPPDYVRYRIDDHIYNVFNLLAVLGKIRILYLPDVVFEHRNFVLNASKLAEYRPDEKIHQIDTKRFNELLPERKALALRLMDHIDRRSASDVSRVRESLLNQVTDSVALRRPEYVKLWSDNKILSTENTRVTIGVVSANLKSDHARTCIDLIKKYTRNFDLVVLDNNRRPTFNHPYEMNKLISICDTDFLVLMDDDVFVESGWLDGLMRCMTPSVGVVTPLHKDQGGNLSYAGVVMRPDYSGHHTHSFAVAEGATRIQTLCSAILLIDVSKCGHIRFDECFSKYFLDIDYGLRVWEAGFEVVCSPYSMVTHIGGATLQHGSNRSNDLVETDRQHYVKEWIATGRYRQLEQEIWQKIPEIKTLLDVPQGLAALLEERPQENLVRFRDLFKFLKDYPTIKDWAYEKVQELVDERRSVGDADSQRLEFLLGCGPCPVPIEQNYNDLTIVLYDANFYATPRAEAAFNCQLFTNRCYSRCYQAESLEILKARIRGDVGETAVAAPSIEDSVGDPILVAENDDGMNIIFFAGDYYAIPQGEGPFDCETVEKGGYSRSYRAKSLNEIKTLVSANGSDASNNVRRLLRTEKSRIGSWKPAIRSVSKKMLKRSVVSTLGFETFLRIKASYLQIREEQHKRGAWLPALTAGTRLAFDKGIRILSSKLGVGESGVKNLVALEGQKSLTIAETADPERWLNASPITLVEADYRGYSIYRFEYKFFAFKTSKIRKVFERLRRVCIFSYQDFKQGKYDPCLIRHSLSEVRAAVDDLIRSNEATVALRWLVFACLPQMKLKPLLDRVYSDTPVTLLVEKASSNEWADYDSIVLEQDSRIEWARSQDSDTPDPPANGLVSEKFDRIVIPWSFPETWADNSLEVAAAKVSSSVEVLHASGERRVYDGENLHRLIYNKAYLASMFQVVPSVEGKTVLEAGCSDGLVCDMVALCGAGKVVGIDVMATVGCGFPHDRINYRVMNMMNMNFPDQTFDLVYSMATFEHLANPYKALLEMLRVTKIDGYGYVQAGPLYCSPFGHHMFAYFQDYPWIHLRKTKQDIVAFAKERGIDRAIERDMFIPYDRYIDGMLNRDHVNGLLLEEYRLEEFRERDDIEVLKFNISYEGKDLLTPALAAEIRGVDTGSLVEHGFEMAFRRIK